MLRTFNTLLFDKQSLVGIKTPIKHILVINWNGKIGDAIVSSFFYREIRKINGIVITVITTKQLKSLYSDHYKVDNVFVVSEKLSYLELFHISTRLKDVDTIIPLMGLLSTKDLFFISRLKPSNLFSLDGGLGYCNVKIADNLLMHEIYSSILKQMGVKNVIDEYIIPVTKKNIHDYDITFNPFASRMDKSLPIGKSINILRLLLGQFPNKTIGILSTTRTRKIAQDIVKRIDNKNVSVIRNVNSFYDAINVIDSSIIVISVDTSIVHIAAGLNKKLIAIYYMPGKMFNSWLPKESKYTKIIFSHGSYKYIKKNMCNFNDCEVLLKFNELYR